MRLPLHKTLDNYRNYDPLQDHFQFYKKALKYDKPEIVLNLLKYSNMDHPLILEETALWAIHQNHMNILLWILELESFKMRDLWTLYQAASDVAGKKSDFQFLELFVQNYGWIPDWSEILRIAALHGNMHSVEIALKEHPMEDYEWELIVHEALGKGNPQIRQYLSFNHHITIRISASWVAEFAVRYGNTKLLKIMFRRGILTLDEDLIHNAYEAASMGIFEPLKYFMGLNPRLNPNSKWILERAAVHGNLQVFIHYKNNGNLYSSPTILYNLEVECSRHDNLFYLKIIQELPHLQCDDRHIAQEALHAGNFHLFEMIYTRDIVPFSNIVTAAAHDVFLLKKLLERMHHLIPLDLVQVYHQAHFTNNQKVVEFLNEYFERESSGISNIQAQV